MYYSKRELHKLDVDKNREYVKLLFIQAFITDTGGARIPNFGKSKSKICYEHNSKN